TENLYRRSNRVAIRFCPGKLELDAAVAPGLIVAVQIRGSVIRSQQHIEIAIAVEIAIGKAAPDDRCFKTASQLSRNVTKFSRPLIQEKLRRLRVAHVAAIVSHRLINVPV